jgi:hypothetical protein
MPCILRVSGKDFASRSYARRTTLPVIKVSVRGEPRLPKTKPNGEKHKTSGVNVQVSNADFTNLKRQIRDAVTFLERHRRALRRLGRASGVERLTLDFGVADRGVAAQFDYFPPELIAAAGSLGIGIEVSRYHAFARV